jgi:protein phosphatase
MPMNSPTLMFALGVLIAALIALCVTLVVILLRARSAGHTVSSTKSPHEQRPMTDRPPRLHEGEEPDVDITRVAPFVVGKRALPGLPVLDDDEMQGKDGEPTGEDSEAILQYEGESWMGLEEPTGPTDVISTLSTGKTDRGVTRRRNEDSFLVDPLLDLYVVADGMGGYAGGDVASRMAVSEVREAIRLGVSGKSHPDRPRRGAELIAAIERANVAIFEEVRRNPALEGMGTTLVAARFSARKQRVYIAHVGDSRVYRLRADKLQVMTTDHTLGARGVTGALASNIRRAVGIGPTVKVDLIVDTPLAHDVYLLCSDGLTKMVDDEQIRSLLSQASSEHDLTRAASALIARANARGGRDNVTVVLIQIRDVTVGRASHLRQLTGA